MEISTEGKRPDLSELVLAKGKEALRRGGVVGLVEIKATDRLYAAQVTQASTLDDIRQQLSHIPE